MASQHASPLAPRFIKHQGQDRHEKGRGREGAVVGFPRLHVSEMVEVVDDVLGPVCEGVVVLPGSFYLWVPSWSFACRTDPIDLEPGGHQVAFERVQQPGDVHLLVDSLGCC